MSPPAATDPVQKSAVTNGGRDPLDLVGLRISRENLRSVEITIMKAFLFGLVAVPYLAQADPFLDDPAARTKAWNDQVERQLQEQQRYRLEHRVRTLEFEKANTEQKPREETRRARKYEETGESLRNSGRSPTFVEREREAAQALAESAARYARFQEDQAKFAREKEIWRREDEKYTARNDARARLAIEGEKLRLKQQDESRQVPSGSERPDLDEAFGIPHDVKPEEIEECRKAAEQGDVSAQYALAGCYSEGKGMPKDDAEAVKWWRKAAQQGDFNSMFFLALSYRDGEGVPKDITLTYKWFNLSAAAGDKEAGKQRDAMVRTMTPEQIAEAQKMSREWKPTKEFIPVEEVPDKAPSAEKKRTAFDDVFDEPSTAPHLSPLVE